MTATRIFSSGIILVIIGILIACNIYSLIPLYTAIGDEMGVGSKKIAYGSTIFTICYAFGLLFFGPISDRFGRKETLTVGLALSSLTTFLVSLASDPISLYLLRGLQGFTLASFAPVAFAYSFEIFKEKERLFWIALINAGFLAAGIIGQLISTILLQVGNWQIVYISYSGIYTLLFLIGIILLPKTNVTGHKETATVIIKQMIKLLMDRNLRKLYTIVLTILLIFVGFYEALNYYLANSGENIMLVRSAGLIGAFVAVFTGGLIYKYSAMHTLCLGLLLGLSSIIILLFMNSLLLISISSIFLVAAIAILIPTIISLIGSHSGLLRGKALSLYSFILLLGAGIAPLIAAYLSYKTLLFTLVLVFSVDLLLYRSFQKVGERNSIH